VKTGEKVALVGVGSTLAIGAIVLLARPAKAAPPGTGTLTGLVMDAVGPLPGVRVTLDSKATTTDGAGTFTFAGVVPGPYSMSFSKAGYETLYL
jgi:hypothetical protein